MIIPGFENTNSFEPYESFDECKLPWGCMVGCKGTPYHDFDRGLLDAINYFRREAETFSEEDLSKLFIAEENDVSEFVRKNLSKIKLIARDSYKNVSDGYLGRHTREHSLETKTPYGFTDIILYIRYSMRTRTFEVVFNRSAFNWSNAEQRQLEDMYFRSITDTIEAWKLFIETDLINRFEFIPLVIDNDYHATISHKAYRTYYGKIDAVECPIRGINILEDEKEMNALKDWLEQGGRINKRALYLILANRDDRSKHYLKKFKKE